MKANASRTQGICGTPPPPTRDTAKKEFVTRRFHDMGIAGEGATWLERSKLERMRNWLLGFLRDVTLCKRAPI